MARMCPASPIAAMDEQPQQPAGRDRNSGRAHEPARSRMPMAWSCRMCEILIAAVFITNIAESDFRYTREAMAEGIVIMSATTL
jgi:hypothetical protein